MRVNRQWEEVGSRKAEWHLLEPSFPTSFACALIKSVPPALTTDNWLLPPDPWLLSQPTTVLAGGKRWR
jgi:hypothetical protein